MTWAAPPTFTSGNVLTAAQLNILAGDLNETAAAKASAGGQWFVGTGANALAARTPSSSNVTGGLQATASSAFADLTTLGPTVTVTTGTIALVTVSSQLSNDTATGYAEMAYLISGATTYAANSNNAIRSNCFNFATALLAYSRVNWQTVTAGSNTFKSQYRQVSGGNAQFNAREILVIPVN